MEPIAKQENIKVAIRSYIPLSKSSADPVYLEEGTNAIVCNTITGPKVFNVGNYFAPPCDDIYEKTSAELIEDFVKRGYGGSIIVYGTSRTNKAQTMWGDAKVKGITQSAINGIFCGLKELIAGAEYTVKVCFFIIHNEAIYDLLSKTPLKKLTFNHSKSEIQGISQFTVIGSSDSLYYLNKGLEMRRRLSTDALPSRMETIFSVELTSQARAGKDQIKAITRTINFVELKGSERSIKTGLECKRMEAVKISLSLSAFGNVVSALASKAKFVPYRDSRLTAILKNSLGGKGKCVVIFHIACNIEGIEESLSTLRYANRIKQIENYPEVNVKFMPASFSMNGELIN
eukprot:TRINITY_DN89992_c0_g1_i1.p1 TRINITY_DN89992_c0_g1~~TRINITY_DN89992_c0_g1_i1.p1  ORF type:complete len:345 (+),score=21.22 TRINITY_DN89992_c0_g1_i1:104-1138(+)